MGSKVSRRIFLKGAASLAAASQAGLSAWANPAQPIEAVQEFAYGDVALTGGPLKEQFDWVHASYLALSNDRLLKVYRQRAGLPAPGRNMGGWYDADGFVPGHSWGQYVSGLSRLGAITGDASCHAKARELVEGFASALERDDNPFAGLNAEKGWPSYILDKHLAGLIDAYRLSGVRQAKELLPRVVEAARPFLPVHGHDRIGKKDPPYDEPYVMPENLFTAWQITQDRALYDRAVAYLLDRDFFDPLARGEDVLPGKHAYSHAIALSSAGKAYLTLGDGKYKRAMQHAWDFIETNQQFASGGWGPEEQFVVPHQGRLYDSLSSTKAHFETPCGSYAQIKLARYLLRFTGDSRYGDGLERVLYNALLGVKRPDSDGDYPYYSSYGPAATKEFYPQKWPCCSGTLVQGVADYVLNLYFHSADGVYVNLFAPSTVQWQGIRLVQETRYPAEDTIALRIETAEPKEFVLRVRIPGWLKHPAQVTINGNAEQMDAPAGRFLAIRRRWNNGDRVVVRLPQEFRTEPIDDLHRNTVAVMRGPLMFVALNPWEELSKTPIVLPAHLQHVGSQTYVQQVAGRQAVFVPFHTVQSESYNTYFLQA